MKIFFPILIFSFLGIAGYSQTGSIVGSVKDGRGNVIEYANIYLTQLEIGEVSDGNGAFHIQDISVGMWEVEISVIGFKIITETVEVKVGSETALDIVMERSGVDFDEIVVTGTMKPVTKMSSPVPVEVYHPAFFKKNPSPSVFESLGAINGVRPQINCNVCNTGDIHINGLEGAYTMMLIDGMPIVSSLGTVYGFSGIPSSLIERVEVVKGSASSLYGSEAMGGLINIITRNPQHTPLLSADLYTSTWGEFNGDIGLSFNLGKKASVLTGLNYFNFQNKVDKDGDGFTDMTLQDRFSVFQKWSFAREKSRIFTIATRYLYEDRWGGDMRWNKSYRGGDEIYGESIYTHRMELLGNYQLPIKEKMFFGFSVINHDQDSRYGDESFIANQKIAFGQLTWDKRLGFHDLLAGATMRYTYYDDNTPVTATLEGENDPEKIWLPGIFLQDEINLTKRHVLLLGLRYDHNNIHGGIFTPRLAYKWTLNHNNVIRVNTGTGYRVVNVFSEDHAALTGGRDVVILSDLKPEQSYNVNVNYTQNIYSRTGSAISFDGSVFYTYFTNRIVPDFESNPTQIIYDNLHGHSISKGVSLNINMSLSNGLSFIVGASLIDNTLTEAGITEREMKAERFTGTWSASYTIAPWHLSIDYTGNIYGPMKLPLQGELDPRPGYSPWWSIQNIQFNYEGFDRLEIYAGVKNLLNWTIGKSKGLPFLIARPHDPFDENVVFDENGEAVVTPENPYGLVFDPDSYAYGLNQGIHGVIGLRYKLR